MNTAMFLPGTEYMPTNPAALPPSVPLYSRASMDTFTASADILKRIQDMGPGADPNAILAEMAKNNFEISRALTSSQVPYRENLEAEASILIPLETPVRNLLPRTPGSSVASKWKVVTSMGGGWGAATLSTSSGNSASQAVITLANAANIVVGDTLYIGSGGTFETHIVSSISGSAITLTTNLANAQNSVAVVKGAIQPGGGPAAQVFYSETGAPATLDTTYVSEIESYKLLGQIGAVTGFAMAAGATFQNQLAQEKTNAIRNVMLLEENAIINGSASIITAPWGDGTNALGYDGMLASINTANGTPANQIQTAVGPLTTDLIDGQLINLWNQGAQAMFILASGQEINSLAHIATGGSENYRIVLDQTNTKLGVRVAGYQHPISSEVVDVIPSRFLSPGTMIIGCMRLPDGKPAADVDVLPQVALPELAPNKMVQGYTAQELAPTVGAPQVYPFLVSIFSVFRMKSFIHFSKISGITAVA